MNYELAKELKDAGFPQVPDGLGRWIDKFSQTYSAFAPADTSDAYIPTLSELLKACGGKFNVLQQKDDESWWAFSRNARPAKSTSAPTPEEAVTRLWLVLNKKI